MTAPLSKSLFKKQAMQVCISFMQTVQRNFKLEQHLMKWAEVNKEDAFGFTALYWAISHHNIHNVKLLIEYGASLRVTDTMNAIFYAIDCDNLEALKYFIDKGIDKDITRNNKKGEMSTLLDHAKSLKRKVIIEYLNG